MCTALKDGGLRCAGHAKADIVAATKEFDMNPSQEASDKIALAENAYYSTPEGIAKLREAGEHAKADRQQILRDIKVKEASQVKVETEAEKAANEALAAREAKRAFYRTPEGIAKLRAAGKHDAADKLESERAFTEEEQRAFDELSENETYYGHALERMEDMHPKLQDAIIASGKGLLTRYLARNRQAIQAPRLNVLAQSEDAETAKGAVNNPNATLDVLKTGLKHPNGSVRQQVYQSSKWAKYCQDNAPAYNSNSDLGEPWEKQAMIEQHQTVTVELLERLSTDEDEHVRIRVARHPQTPRPVVEKLLMDPHQQVRQYAGDRDPVTNILPRL
jgi:hypothetical protein